MRTTYRIVEYICDAPGCDEREDDVGISFPQLARILRVQGWQIDRWDALCPTHAKAEPSIERAS